MKLTRQEAFEYLAFARNYTDSVAVSRLAIAVISSIRIEEAAQRLMQLLRANVGDSADWPVEIISDDTAVAEQIAKALTELETALKEHTMKTEHTKEPIATVDNEWKAKAERLESILTCTEKPLPPGCARTRYALEEKLVKATDLLRLAVDRLEQAYVASEQHLGATPAKSWEVAANGVRKFREGIASLDARAALAANKEAR